VKHVVLTRAVYGPDWPEHENRARLEQTRLVTAPLMAAQTSRDWTWRVLLHPDDPLLRERGELLESVAPNVELLFWTPPEVLATAEWDRRPEIATHRDLIAATAYRAPWLDADDTGVDLLQTRIDDDDGFAPDALERFARAAKELTARTALMLPYGIRVWGGRMDLVQHSANAMSSLFTPAGDALCIYDYGHVQVRAKVRTMIVDRRLGWLWIRHPYTLSGWRRARSKITPAVIKTFPIDWRALGAHL
jgi:hypothetical protein